MIKKGRNCRLENNNEMYNDIFSLNKIIQNVTSRNDETLMHMKKQQNTYLYKKERVNISQSSQKSIEQEEPIEYFGGSVQYAWEKLYSDDSNISLRR